MTRQEKTNPDGAAKGCGCGGSSATALATPAEPAKAGCCGGAHDHAHHDHGAPAAGSSVKALDPVCGMTVDPATSKHASTTAARPIISVRPAAGPSSPPTRKPISTRASRKPPRRRARSTPARCTRRSARSVPATARSAAWRWSRRWRAGYAAQPRTRRHDAAVLDRPGCCHCRSSSWKWAVTSSAVMDWVESTLSNWIQLAFASPVVLWAGWPFFVRGWQSIVTRNLNMFTLIAMGTGVACVYSVVGTVLPGEFPGDFPRARRRGRGLLRGCRRDHRPGAARPGAGTAGARGRRPARSRPCSTWRRRPRAASATTAPTRRSRSTVSSSATSCGCGRERRCRSTASFSRAVPRSMNPW